MSKRSFLPLAVLHRIPKEPKIHGEAEHSSSDLSSSFYEARVPLRLCLTITASFNLSESHYQIPQLDNFFHSSPFLLLLLFLPIPVSESVCTKLRACVCMGAAWLHLLIHAHKEPKGPYCVCLHSFPSYFLRHLKKGLSLNPELASLASLAG